MSLFTKRIAKLVFTLLLLNGIFSVKAYCYVDLHAHLFMKKGISWLFSGDFFEPLAANDWRDGFSSQANPKTLNESGLTVVVAALYTHPLFRLSLRDSIRDQIEQAKEFVRQNPEWVIATSAQAAKRAVRENKRVMILALEGASGILDHEEDLAEFIDQSGIRIVTFLHVTDDQYGGVAFLKGILGFSSPFARILSLFSSNESEGVTVNPNGLTEEGKKFAQSLMARGVWIDLAHSSDETQKTLIPMLRSAGQPLLYTHTALRRFHQAERGIALWQLKEVAASKGIVGVMPAELMLKGTKVDAVTCGGCENEKCQKDSFKRFVVQFNAIAEKIGSESTVMGSDFNGAIPHLSPPLCFEKGPFQEKGFFEIGQVKEFWPFVRKNGGHLGEDYSKRSTSRFLDAWSKVKPYFF